MKLKYLHLVFILEVKESYVLLWICDALRDLVPFIQLKKRENTHGGVLLLACNFTKSNSLPWVFFTFKIVQMVPNHAKRHIWRLKYE